MRIRYDYCKRCDDTAMNGLEVRYCNSSKPAVGGDLPWNIQKDKVIEQGHHGTWDQKFTMCPEGSYVTAMQARQERKQGRFRDDTALNGVRIRCRSKTWEKTGEFMVNQGEHGDWESWSMETYGYFMKGGKMKMGKEKRSVDLTGANGLKIQTAPLPIQFFDLKKKLRRYTVGRGFCKSYTGM
jgi:hypothetical protein